MRKDVLQCLRCPSCQGTLRCHGFREPSANEVECGVAWCLTCRNWHPIEDDVLELLAQDLAYADDRRHFWERHETELRSLGLEPFGAAVAPTDVEAQRKQQQHFDWYADNDTQSYSAYEQMPFWRAVDAAVYGDWRRDMREGKWLLDVGCAQGRSLSQCLDLPLQIVGFDISKRLVCQAAAAYRKGRHAARASFLVADASTLPFTAESFDYVLIYGVLHHLPDPARTCREVARVLRPGGSYFGSENNQTIFRAVFDLLQRLNPLWHEEAGAQPLISARELRHWFGGTGVSLQSRTHVFVPPHLVNLLGRRWGARLLSATDWVGSRLPFLRHNGGLVTVVGRKADQASGEVARLRTAA